MDKIKFVLCLFFIWTSCFIPKIEAQESIGLLYCDNSKIDSSKVATLSFRLENLNFFRNLEYKAELSKGYTLPGFRLSPIVAYQPLSNAKFELGVRLLKYWGRHLYPASVYTDLPEMEAENYQKYFHYYPHLRAQVQLFKGGDLIVGSIYGGANHGLVEPLYNKDLNMIADPESGIQLLLDLPHFKTDMWVDWHSFMFRADTCQERFTFGSASRFSLNLKEGLTLSVPIQVLARHRGGELNREDLEIYTFLNYAGGIALNYKVKDHFVQQIAFQSLYAGFSDLKERILFYKNGGGVFSELNILTRWGNFRFAYWNADHYFSVYGSPLFGNKSESIPGMYLKHAEFFYTGWNIQKHLGKGVDVGCDLDLHYLPSSSSVGEDGWSLIHKGGINFGAGVYLRFSPSWVLKSFN